AIPTREAAHNPGVSPAAVSLVNCYIEIFQRRAAEQAAMQGRLRPFTRRVFRFSEESIVVVCSASVSGRFRRSTLRCEERWQPTGVAIDFSETIHVIGRPLP